MGSERDIGAVLDALELAVAHLVEDQALLRAEQARLISLIDGLVPPVAS